MELTLNPLSCFVCVGLTVESILSGIDVESVVLFCVSLTVEFILSGIDVESIIFVLCVWVQQLHLF